MTTNGYLEHTDVRSASNDEPTVGDDDGTEPRRCDDDNRKSQEHDSAVQATRSSSSSSADQCQPSDTGNDVFIIADVDDFSSVTRLWHHLESNGGGMGGYTNFTNLTLVFGFFFCSSVFVLASVTVGCYSDVVC